MYINDSAKQEVNISKLHISHDEGFYKGYTQHFPYVDDEAIWIPAVPFTRNGTISTYQPLITRELFIEAYNKWIKGDNA